MNNVASINMSSAAFPAMTSDGLSPAPLLVDGAVPEGFTMAFVAQLDLLTELNSQADLPQSVISEPLFKPDDKQAITNELAVGNGSGQNLAALLGKDLPMSYKATDESEPEAHLVAVTEAINYFEAGQSKAEKKPQADIPLIETTTVDKVDNDIENLVQPITTPLQLQSEAASASVDRVEEYQQDAKADEQNSVALTEQSPEIIAASAALLVPSTSTVSSQVKIDNTSSRAQSDKPMLVTIKTPSQNASAVNMESDSASRKSNTTQSSMTTEQNVQWQPLSTEKASTDGHSQFTMLVSEDASLPKPAVELAKLDRLSVNREDVPSMTKPLGHPDWDEDMGQRILWMQSKSISAAEIKLNPPHLGPITVRIDMNQDQASVAFSAQHGAAREALEAAIPKLREMMSSQNLNLADVDVSPYAQSSHGQSQSQNFAQTARHQQQNGSISHGDDIGVSGEGSDSKVVISKGLLSMYA